MIHDFPLVPVPEDKQGCEEVCYCPECRGDKLHVNKRTHLFHCKHCHFSGKHYQRGSAVYEEIGGLVEDEEPSDAMHSFIRQRMKDHDDDPTQMKEAGFRISRRLQSIDFLYHSFTKYPYWVEGMSLCSPAQLLAASFDGTMQWSGYQSYLKGRDPKYIYRGTKGIMFPRNMPLMDRRFILTEGRFDCYALASREETQDWEVICSMGNSLTEDMLRLLIWLRPTEVAVAFDNDKLSAFTKVYNTLCPYIKVLNLMPPVNTYPHIKDWDEFFVKGVDEQYPDEVASLSEKLNRR